MKKILNYFTKFEMGLWLSSVIIIIATFYIFEDKDYLTLFASIIGATFLILNAKGNPLGQFLTIVFSILYGFISYKFLTLFTNSGLGLTESFNLLYFSLNIKIFLLNLIF